MTLTCYFLDIHIIFLSKLNAYKTKTAVDIPHIYSAQMLSLRCKWVYVQKNYLVIPRQS